MTIKPNCGIILLLIFFACTKGTCQDSLTIIEENSQLRNPFTGGLNEPYFSEIDLNLDGMKDLVAFDRSGNILLPFVKELTGDSIIFSYEESYSTYFPNLSNWVVLRDVNGDKKADIITHSPGESGIRVFKNVSTSILSFQLWDSLLQTVDSSLVYVPATDIPAIEDIDFDGDLDILSFDANGLRVIWYQNLSVETTGTADSLIFQINTSCWGSFQEAGLDNSIILDQSCNEEANVRTTLHAGSTLSLVNFDQEERWDLLLGDISHENIVFLRNNGDSQRAIIDSTLFRFPQGDPVSLHFFPAVSKVDLDPRDNMQELIFAPNALNVSDNFNQIWVYAYPSDSINPSLTLTQTNFLQKEMIDCGANSHPVLWDYNGDGLKDLIIGNKAYQTEGNIPGGSLTLYEHTGTISQPEYTLKSRDFLSISNLFPQPIQDLHLSISDIDNDGTDDLILGDINGQIHWLDLQRSGDSIIASINSYRWKGIDVGQYAKPFLFDVNQDGLLDLLVGELNGNINYFENGGTSESPEFEAIPTIEKWGGIDLRSSCCNGFSTPFVTQNQDNTYTLFVGSENGTIYIYSNLTDLLSPTFVSTDSIKLPGSRSTVFGYYGLSENILPEQKDALGLLVGDARGGVHWMRVNPTPTDLSDQSIVESDVTIYPNPSLVPSFTISTPSFSNKVSIEMINSLGQMVLSEILMPGKTLHTIQAGQLPKGLYLIRMSPSSSQLIVKKWLYCDLK